MKYNALKIIIIIIALCIFGSAAARSIVDDRGRRISVDTPFNRIISLYSAHTENLFHIGASDQLSGVSVNDTYPGEVDKKPKFSYHDGVEKFIAAQPDLVLIRPMIDNGYPQFVKQLESYGIKVVSLQPATVEEMYDYWETLGELTGKTEYARAMVFSVQKPNRFNQKGNEHSVKPQAGLFPGYTQENAYVHPRFHDCFRLGDSGGNKCRR